MKAKLARLDPDMPKIFKNLQYGTQHRLEDEIIYLYLIKKMPQQQVALLQEMKLLFLLKYHAFEQNEVISHLDFVKYQNGPVSSQQYDIRARLIQANLIIEEKIPYYDRPIQLTHLSEAGKIVLEKCSDIFSENAWVFTKLDGIIAQYGNIKNARELARTYVYPLVVNNKRIEDYAPKEPIYFRYKNIGKNFELDEDWDETCDFAMSKAFVSDDVQPPYEITPFKPFI